MRTPSSRRSASRRHVREIGAITVVAFVVRLALALALPLSPAWDGVLYARGASSIARDGAYTQRAIRDDAPARASAFYPVGWPAVLSLVRWAGARGADTASGHVADLVLQSALGSLAAACAYLLGRRARGAVAGRIAGMLVALAPGSVLICASWLAEPLFTALLALAALPLAYARRRHRLRALALSAFVLGLAAYVRPVALPIALLLALFVARDTRRTTRIRYARLRAVVVCTLVSAASVVLPIAPWIARNADQMHAAVLVSTNGGANLLLGTVGDGRYGAIPAELDCPHGLREVERDRCRTQHALQRLRAAPVAALLRGARKLFDTFAYEASPALVVAAGLPTNHVARSAIARGGAVASTIGWLVLVALAVVALRRSRLLPRALVDFTYAATLGTALLHAVYLGGDRYHLPLVPLFAALAAVTLVNIRAASRRDHPR